MEPYPRPTQNVDPALFSLEDTLCDKISVAIGGKRCQPGEKGWWPFHGCEKAGLTNCEDLYVDEEEAKSGTLLLKVTGVEHKGTLFRRRCLDTGSNDIMRCFHDLQDDMVEHVRKHDQNCHQLGIKCNPDAEFMFPQ